MATPGDGIKESANSVGGGDVNPRVVPAARGVTGDRRPIIALAGFETWNLQRQREALAELERAPSLDAETSRFLLLIVQDRAAGANMRNLAANALTAPGRWVGGLAAMFLRQARDASDDGRWRDYALQHATVVALQGGDTDQVIGALTEHWMEGSDLSATAVLMLQRLHAAGHAALPQLRLEECLHRIAREPDRDINLSATLLGVWAERTDAPLTGQVMAFANAKTPMVRRAACGTMGRLGGLAELAILEKMKEGDDDHSVCAAADVAVSRIKGRVGHGLSPRVNHSNKDIP